MMRRGHIGFSALVSSAVLAPLHVWGVVGAWEALVTFLVLLWATPLPDLDVRAPLVRHRGFTHSVWFGLVLAAPAGLVAGFLESDLGVVVGVGVFAGVVLHLAADSLTCMGVRPLAPLCGCKVGFRLVRADGRLANGCLALLGLLSALWLLLVLGAGGVLGEFVAGLTGFGALKGKNLMALAPSVMLAASMLCLLGFRYREGCVRS